MTDHQIVDNVSTGIRLAEYEIKRSELNKLGRWDFGQMLIKRNTGRGTWWIGQVTCEKKGMYSIRWQKAKIIEDKEDKE